MLFHLSPDRLAAPFMRLAGPSSLRPRSAAAALAGVALFCAAVLLLPPPWAVLLVIAPLLEETVLRAGLQEALLRRLALRGAAGATAANLGCALAFAAAHLLQRPSALAALTLLPALWLGWVYQQQRRVAPCIALHALMNAAWLLWPVGAP